MTDFSMQMVSHGVNICVEFPETVTRGGEICKLCSTLTEKK